MFPWFCYFYCMTDLINGKTYNTEKDIPKKFIVEEEELGDGYIRYTTRVVYYCERREEYYLYVNSTTTKNKRCEIFDTHGYIVPVSEEWARNFNRDTECLYPATPGLQVRTI